VAQDPCWGIFGAWWCLGHAAGNLLVGCPSIRRRVAHRPQLKRALGLDSNAP
jgi:hypothetical protein